MNKYFFVIFFCFFLINCNKDKEKNILQYKQSFDNLMDINNYVIEKKSIKDSLCEFEGTNGNYLLTGIYNHLNSEKIGWWTLYSRKKADKLLKVEYLNDGEKIIKNQIIFYSNGKIDTLFSKFFTKNINKEKIIYKFYTPIKAYSNSQIYTHAMYAFYTNSNNLQKGNMELKKEGSHYELILNIPTDKNYFKALFSESEINLKNSSEGVNRIFIQDTIK